MAILDVAEIEQKTPPYWGKKGEVFLATFKLPEGFKTEDVEDFWTNVKHKRIEGIEGLGVTIDKALNELMLRFRMTETVAPNPGFIPIIIALSVLGTSIFGYFGLKEVRRATEGTSGIVVFVGLILSLIVVYAILSRKKR